MENNKDYKWEKADKIMEPFCKHLQKITTIITIISLICGTILGLIIGFTETWIISYPILLFLFFGPSLITICLCYIFMFIEWLLTIFL